MVGHILAFLMGWTVSAHNIHLSITEIEQNDGGFLEVSIKTFKDDLQAAVGLPQSGELSDQYVGADQLISDYVLDHFTISSNDHTFELLYEESIPSGDIVWIYLKSNQAINEEELVLRNTFMLELFNDQSNIINLNGLKKQKLVLDNKTQEKRFQF